jgi:hypothetical protein
VCFRRKGTGVLTCGGLSGFWGLGEGGKLHRVCQHRWFLCY